MLSLLLSLSGDKETRTKEYSSDTSRTPGRGLVAFALLGVSRLSWTSRGWWQMRCYTALLIPSFVVRSSAKIHTLANGRNVLQRCARGAEPWHQAKVAAASMVALMRLSCRTRAFI